MLGVGGAAGAAKYAFPAGIPETEKPINSTVALASHLGFSASLSIFPGADKAHGALGHDQTKAYLDDRECRDG